MLINLIDLTNEKQNGQFEANNPKGTGYIPDADTSSSSAASAPQSSDSEDDVSNKTETTATTETQKGIMVSPKLPLLCCIKLMFRISNGNRTEWSPIQSLIIRVITKSDDRTAGVRFVSHEYDYRLNWTTRSLITN